MPGFFDFRNEFQILESRTSSSNKFKAKLKLIELVWTGMNQSGQLRTKKTFYFFTLSWLLKWTPKLFVGVCVGEHRRPKFRNFKLLELVWTSLNQSSQFRIKKDLLLFYYFIIFYNSDRVIRYSRPTHGLVDCIPVRSGLFRFYPVLFCSKLFRNEFGSVRFWSFLNWYPVLSIGPMSDNIRWFLMFTLSEIIFKFKIIETDFWLVVTL